MSAGMAWTILHGLCNFRSTTLHSTKYGITWRMSPCKSVYTQLTQPKENGYLLGSKYSRYLSNLSILTWSIVVQLYRIVLYGKVGRTNSKWSMACMDGLRTGRWESVCSAFLGKLWVAAATEGISWEDLLMLGFAEIIDNIASWCKDKWSSHSTEWV